jgi:hypothetical protein
MRLYIVGEGSTEEQIVTRVIGPHLACHGVGVQALSVNGGSKWSRWRKVIGNLLRSPAPDLRVTTLFDYYRFPSDIAEHSTSPGSLDVRARIGALEQAMLANLGGDRRFLPYVQQHELEALVLARLDELEAFLEPGERAGLRALRESIAGIPPEQVNDDDKTAPSKRLADHIPSYRKTLHGPLALAGSGLHAVRDRCPRFDGWIKRLEALGSSVAS